MDVEDKPRSLTRQRATLQGRLTRLVEVLTEGGNTFSIVAKVRELEASIEAVSQQLASPQPLPRLDPRALEDRLAEWRRMLRQSNTQARTVLERVLAGRIVFTPNSDGPTRFKHKPGLIDCLQASQRLCPRICRATVGAPSTLARKTRLKVTTVAC